MPPAARIVADPNTGAFPVVKCAACHSVTIHHRCLAVIAVGGLLFGDTGETVCATPI
jgi:hypothetical protein